MKTKTMLSGILVFAIAASALALQFFPFQEVQSNNCFSAEGKEQVFFCPEDNCAQQLMQKINESKKSIHVAVYSITSEEIANALVEAKKRGVEVKIITDFVQAAGQYSKDEFLKQAGIELKLKKISQGSMHNKFAIIDSKITATGSFNYTQNADERNDENLVFIGSTEIAGAFEAEFQEIWEQAS